MRQTACSTSCWGGAITRLLGATALLVGMCFSPLVMAAGEIPTGCNANTFQISINRDKAAAVPGETVNFGVSVVVTEKDAFGVLGCNTENVSIYAQCPDLIGTDSVPPATPKQYFPLGSPSTYNFPAPTAPTIIGSIACTMPATSVAKTVYAWSGAEGTLRSSTAGSSFTRTNNIDVDVNPCDVKVDKQVSCDGGTTWVDAGLVKNNEGGTENCSVIGLSGPVKVRYQAQNTSPACALTSCVLTESNATFGTPPAVGGIAPNTTTDFLPAANSPACSTAYGNPETPNEPNVVGITCQTGGTPVSASDTASFACLSVDAQVDRQVTCDGGSSYADPGLERTNEDGTNGCTAIDGAPVNWRYQGCNSGTAPLYDCTLVDQNGLVSDPIVLGNLAPLGQAGDCSALTPATKNPVNCGDALEGSEAIGPPAKGTVDMTCCTNDVASIDLCDTANKVKVFDASTVTCTTPSGLNAVKECVDTDANGIDDNVRVVASATAGDLGFVDCTAQDTLYRSAGCPATGDGSSVALTPEGGFVYPFSLAPAGSKALFGTIDPALARDACNTASVTCTIEGTATTVTANAPPVECDWQGGECYTRTPGFWGNRPVTTAQFLPVTVCGTTINNVSSGNDTSAIEAICSTGTDMKILGQQETQLIRQCTAAALNIKATAAYNGDCTDVYQDLAADFAACCGGDSICTGDSVEGYSVGECIEKMDFFNNSNDTANLPAFSGLGAAKPQTCKDSKGNKIVVGPTP